MLAGFEYMFGKKKKNTPDAIPALRGCINKYDSEHRQSVFGGPKDNTYRDVVEKSIDDNLIAGDMHPSDVWHTTVGLIANHPNKATVSLSDRLEHLPNYKTKYSMGALKVGGFGWNKRYFKIKDDVFYSYESFTATAENESIKLADVEISWWDHAEFKEIRLHVTVRSFFHSYEQ